MGSFPANYSLFTLIGVLGLSGGAALAAPSVDPVAVTIPAGTHIHVRLGQSLDTKRDKPGTPFIAHASAPVVHRGEVIVPRGAVCHGHVVESKPSGRLKGRPVMRLALDAIEIDGHRYTVETSGPGFAGKRHKKRNIGLIGGGATTGAAIGAVAGGGVGAAIGAGAGAAVGTTTAFITGKKNLRIPAETRVVFTLRTPVRVRG